MSIERIFHCDGPDCEAHVQTVRSRPEAVFLILTEADGHALHFCSWDCVLKHAATKEPTQVL